MQTPNFELPFQNTGKETAHANTAMAKAPTITATTLDGPTRVPAPTNGVTPVGCATTAELEPPATPGTPGAGDPGAIGGAGGLVAAACAGAGLPAARPTDEEAPVVKAT